MDLGLAGKLAHVAGEGAIADAIARRLRAEGCALGEVSDAGLDILVCCPQHDRPGRIDEVTTQDLQALLQAQLVGPWELVRRAAPQMRKRRSGRVILVVDAAAKVPAVDTLAASVCGAAQLALAKSLSDDLGRDGVLVNAVCVAHVEGHPARAVPQPFVGRSLEQQEAGWGRDVPLGRRGTPEDVAGAVAFLASGRAAFILGANIDVDAGHQRSVF